MNFFKQHSYEIIKLIVNQIGMTIFGLVLTFASSAANMGGTLRILIGLFCACFYLYLVYVVAWDMGAADKIRVEAQRISRDDVFGLKLMLCAELPNLILAAFLWIGAIFLMIGGGFFGSVGNLFYSVSLVIDKFIQAMYLGLIMAVSPAKDAFFLNALIYTLTVIPGLFAVWLGYFLGIRDIRFLTSPEKPRSH